MEARGYNPLFKAINGLLCEGEFMNIKKKILILIFLFTITSLSSSLYADIWMKHVNSNYADEILSSDSEVWVRINRGGVVRWDISTGEYNRYYETRGLPSNNINEMFYDDEGRFYILESSKNIYRFENGKFIYLTSTPSSLYSICFADGKIIADTNNSKYIGIIRWDGESWQTNSDFASYSIYCIKGDRNGGLWVSGVYEKSGVIVYYKNSQKTTYTMEQVRGNNDFSGDPITKNIYIDPEGIVWLCLNGGVAWFDGQVWRQHYWNNQKIGYSKNITMDTNGIIYAVDNNNGLYSLDGENWIRITQYDGSKILWIENNPNGGLWVGTIDCLESFIENERNPFKIDNLLPINNTISNLCIDKDGNLWCGDNSGDLAILHKETWLSFRGTQLAGTDFGDPGSMNTIYFSETFGIWIGFLYNVFRYDGNIWMNYFNPLVGEIGMGFNSITESPTHEIWIGTYGFAINGLAKWKDKTWEFYHPEVPDPIVKYGGARDMAFDHEGNLWIVSNGIWKFANDEWSVIKSLDTPLLKNIMPKSIKVMSNGDIWAGGDNGIVVFSGNEAIKAYTKEDGLPLSDNGDNAQTFVVDIEEAPDHSIWVLALVGLAAFTGSDFKTYYKDSAGLNTGGWKMAIDSSGRIFTVSILSKSSGITEFIPTSVTLKMSLFADQIAYKAGDKLNISLMVNNYGPDETGDLYFVMLTPDGNFYSGLDWFQGLHPATSNFTIPSDFSLPLTKLLSLTLPSATPPISQPGKYYFMIALADTGTTYLRSKAIVTVNMQ
jgi:ligand-binding sensor domain-containing protein